VVKPDGRLTDDIDPRDRPPRDACGVFGVWSPGEEVAKLAYFGLYALRAESLALQGRMREAQESLNIAWQNGWRATWRLRADSSMAGLEIPK